MLCLYVKDPVITDNNVTWLEPGMYEVERLQGNRALIQLSIAGMKPRTLTLVPLRYGKLIIDLTPSLTEAQFEMEL